MNRRRLVRRLALGWAAAAATCRRAQAAEPPGLRRVGVLAPNTAASEEVTLKSFFDDMRRLGWVEGRNLVYADDLAADLPVEQPNRFELIVNLRAARALSVKVPQSVVLRADRVIE